MASVFYTICLHVIMIWGMTADIFNLLQPDLSKLAETQTLPAFSSYSVQYLILHRIYSLEYFTEIVWREQQLFTETSQANDVKASRWG